MLFRSHIVSLLVACTVGAVTGLASAAGIEELTRLTEQLDKLDKADFQFSLRAGVDCASAREFDCAERQFSKAAKSAVDGKDKRSLADARDLLESYRAQARREELARLREVEERRQQEQARREEEDERVAKQEKYAARVEACEDACADSGQLHLCKTYTIGPSQCNRGSDDNRPNYAAAMLRGLNDSLAGLGQIQRSQNQALGNVLAAIADRERQDQARRDNQRAQQQRSQESEDRAQQRERDRVQRADREAQAAERDQRAQRQREQEEQQAKQRRDQEQQQQRIALAQQASSPGTQRLAASGNADSSTAARMRKPGMTQDDGPCISYGATIPVGKSVCYAESMEQWRCEGSYGKSGFSKVQKIIMKSEIKVDNVCYHVDRANLRPTRDWQLE